MNLSFNNQLAPVIMFVYNRLKHVKETVESLSTNKISRESDLFIYSDGPKNSEDSIKVKSVREYLKTISGFKTIRIIEKEHNNGLANSVIAGVTEVLQKYPKVIVVEDDLRVSSDFLSFMNAALDFYSQNPKIFSISGYNFPIDIPTDYHYDVYLSYRASSWGWATWRDRWNKADWEVQDYQEFKKDKNTQRLFNRGGEDLTPMLHKQMKGIVDSWAIRWAYSHYKNNVYCLFPKKSFVVNIGMDNSGQHAKKSNRYTSDLAVSFDDIKFRNQIEINNDIMIQLRLFFQQSYFRKFVNFITGN